MLDSLINEDKQDMLQSLGLKAHLGSGEMGLYKSGNLPLISGIQVKLEGELSS